MRLFVGIPLAPEVVHQLSALCARLRSSGDGLRWSTPETWHITLQFLGNTSTEQYSCVAARLQELHLPRFPIQLDSPGIFDRVAVFFAGVRPTPALFALQRSVSKATEPCGFAPETRPYQPHITLARAKGQRESLAQLKSRLHSQPAFSSFVAQEFLLYESFLGPTGARHEIRDRFPLSGT